MLPLYFLSYIVIYTEGEVMLGLFRVLIVILAGTTVLSAIYSRERAALMVIGLGGGLLTWQAYQIRKWAMIHEEVVGVIRYHEQIRTATGSYPNTIHGYALKHAGLEEHINRDPTDSSSFRLSYFMNDPGTSYWYDSKSGFGYYPD